MTAHWNIGELKLRYDLVWSVAISSLKVRLPRTLLTVLTITTATAFLMYLLTMPQTDDPSEQQGWALMLALSLLVSVAGVLNTMLMSVTQRYREIGTIKCLGALDSFVLYSVLLESAIVGLVGASMGVIIGLAISLFLGLIDYGSQLFEYLRFGAIPIKIAIVFGVGILLTTLGAAVPAWIASRMPPMDAMRGEK